ncbi:MAG: ABC transporter permease, partial [Gemmatimonadales bacterium]
MLRDLISDLRFRLRAVFRRGDVERELSDELRLHVEIETDRLVGEGLSADEARRQARLSLGGVEQVKEATRDARGLVWVDALAQDLRYAVRGLRRSPTFTGAVVATFALGLGVNVALFTVIDRLVLRPPAYLAEPSRVHRVAQYSLFLGRRDTPIQGMSHERFLSISHATHSFDRIASVGTALDDIRIGTDVHEGANAIVTGGYFDFFDARPARGRFITIADDSEADGAPVVVISYTLWRERFGARNAAVGATLQVDKVTRTIIGIAPEGFVGITNGSRPPEIWTPAGVHTRGPMLVRRKPGVSEAAASADLTAALVHSYETERAVA